MEKEHSRYDEFSTITRERESQGTLDDIKYPTGTIPNLDFHVRSFNITYN